MRRLVLSTVVAGLVVWGAPSREPSAAAAAVPVVGAGRLVHVIDPRDLDTTCAACRDFYKYATGGWQKRHPIPATSPSWSTQAEVAAKNQELVRDVLQRAADRAKGPRPGRAAHGEESATAVSAIDKVGIFYSTCMDSTSAERDGLSALAGRLQRISAIADLNGVRREAAALQRTYYVERATDIGVPAMFIIRERIDPADSKRALLVVEQGGLGLPAPESYTAADSSSRTVRSAYMAHLARLFVLAGDDSASAWRGADRVMAIETALARISRSRAERRRDPYAVYHPMRLAEAAKIAPHLDWNAWLDAAGVPRVSSLNVADPEFFRGLDSLLVRVPVADWRAYLRARLLDRAASWLDARFQAEDLRMQAAVNGVNEQLPRWRRCATAADDAMGEALGQAYVARAFPPEAKVRAEAMATHLKEAFRSELTTLTWMSPETRRNALAKLDALTMLVGYPDRWRKYSQLSITRRPFIDNLLAADEFEFRRQLAKVGRPVDRTDWGMSPATVNAYSDFNLNTIVVPAGILQPPFFDPRADDAENYGAAGALIGHEMAHAFDDNGRKYDASGSLRDWWTPDDAARFERAAAQIAQQFNRYAVIDSVHVNGMLTRRENIADLAGLKIAYIAFKRAEGGSRPTRGAAPTPGEFTAEQWFFLAYARFWAENRRPAYAREMALVDAHAPGRWRVNGPLSDLREFAEAFHCRAGDAMVKEPGEHVAIW